MLPVCTFVLPVFAGVRVDNVGSQTLKSAAEGQVLPKIHLVTKWRSILVLDTNVTQQRLKNNLFRQSNDTCKTEWEAAITYGWSLINDNKILSIPGAHTCASASCTAAGQRFVSSWLSRSSWLVLCWECVCWECVSSVFWSLDSTVLKSDAEGMVGRTPAHKELMKIFSANEHTLITATWTDTDCLFTQSTDYPYLSAKALIAHLRSAGCCAESGWEASPGRCHLYGCQQRLTSSCRSWRKMAPIEEDVLLTSLHQHYCLPKNNKHLTISRFLIIQYYALFWGDVSTLLMFFSVNRYCTSPVYSVNLCNIFRDALYISYWIFNSACSFSLF